MFDTRVIKSPGTFDGTKTRWRHWSTKLRGYVRGVSKTLADMMKIAESQVTKIRHDGLKRSAQPLWSASSAQRRRGERTRRRDC